MYSKSFLTNHLHINDNNINNDKNINNVCTDIKVR